MISEQRQQPSGRLVSSLGGPRVAFLVISVALLTVLCSVPGCLRESAAVAESSLDERRAAVLEWFRAQPRINLDIEPLGAKVLVVAFVDHQCPACRTAEIVLEGLVRQYEGTRPGAIRLVFKDFPLETECNPSVNRDIHPAACDAAVAVRLAGERNERAAMVTWLNAHQEALTKDSLRVAAAEILNDTSFDRRFGALLLEIERDSAQGRALGVRVVPTVFINGIRFSRQLEPVFLEAVVDWELGQR